ncbi:hypothetical protein E1B28_005268 [Marasmius oreades]|uniref:Uncharacterized protein n=1 Tax=Marasmius oreades TaxID=181124 RepID=A0A9P7V0F1_9AGAR|nr:uncharacterized protein E1B28_005268 [Marasmius oreades]KAG7097957.1 hypothetical protein E1B28_005268 [Marasmius oreades]
MKSGIGLPEANFLALVLESLLYGSFCVLFVAAIWAIFTKGQKVNYKLLTTLMTMWLLSTVHLILDVIRAKAAFIDARGLPDGTPGSLVYYLDLSNPLQAAKTAIYVAITLVGDGFMIYRCYVIWGRWYMALIPAMMLCGTGVSGYGATYQFSKAAPGSEVFLPDIVTWVTSFFVLTFATNVICTALIATRILSVQRAIGALSKLHSSRGNLSLKAIIIVTESAALYSVSILSLLISYSSGSNGQYTVLDLTSPLVGVVFTLIILRVTLVSESEQIYSTSIPFSTHTSNSRVARTGPEQYGMQPRATAVSVNVSHFTERDSLDNKVASNNVV